MILLDYYTPLDIIHLHVLKNVGTPCLSIFFAASQAEMAIICSSLADTGKPLLVNCVEGAMERGEIHWRRRLTLGLNQLKCW